MFDPLASLEPFKNGFFLGHPFRRDNERYVLPDSFLRGITKNSLRAGVPTGDDTLQSLADDSVIGGLHDGRHQTRRSVDLLAQRGKFVQQQLGDVIDACFWIIENAVGECFVGGEKLLYVILELKLRMNSSPVMGRPNECQQQQQILKSHCPQQSLDRIDASRGIGRLQEDMSRERKDRIFNLRACSRHFSKRRGTRPAKTQAWL